MAEIYARATTRMKQAYAPGSHRSYYNKFVMYLTFCLYYDIDVRTISVNNCINFIEFLAGSGITTATILTYISAIKAKCLQVGLSCHCWSHHRVALMVRSCSRTVAHQPGAKQVLTPQSLTQLIDLASSLPQGILYKTLFLLAFHGFFRISNLLPYIQRRRFYSSSWGNSVY